MESQRVRMAKIAVIEDEDDYAAVLKNYFRRYGAEKSLKVSVSRFRDAETFLENYLPVYTAVFMDINLPLMDGMACARALRKIDTTVVLIFVTNLSRFACGGYEVGALDFIVKPIGYADFSLKFAKALRVAENSVDAEVMVPNASGFCRISLSRLTYIEVNKHYLYYHLTDGVVKARGTLGDAEKRFEKYRFLRCNKCYLVNPAFVTSVHGYTVTVGGDELQISQPKKQVFLAALTDYIAGNN